MNTLKERIQIYTLSQLNYSFKKKEKQGMRQTNKQSQIINDILTLNKQT